jgi:hypothetical protein
MLRSSNFLRDGWLAAVVAVTVPSPRTGFAPLRPSHRPAAPVTSPRCAGCSPHHPPPVRTDAFVDAVGASSDGRRKRLRSTGVGVELAERGDVTGVCPYAPIRATRASGAGGQVAAQGRREREGSLSALP